MPEPTRRSFLQQASALPLLSLPHTGWHHDDAPPRATEKKILVLGGTGWLGPAFVEAALTAGHELTLFNRGRTNPHLFPEVEKLVGQRRRKNHNRPNSPEQDLTALKGRSWDAVIDTSGYFTGEVEDTANLLRDRCGQYVFISSLSVYPALGTNTETIDEGSELASCDDRYTLDMGSSYERYGALKRYCEDAAAAAFGDRATLVRPGYIVGPGDKSDRFTYWPTRFDRGGECLAPGEPDNELQFIDVRDLGQWLLHVVENGYTGPFNAVGFRGRLNVQEFLHTGKTTRNLDCSFTWVDDAFLQANKVSSWGDMGCWTPKVNNGHCDNQRAIDHGLVFRPIADTIRDTADWAATRPGDYQWRAGLSADRERELLERFKSR
jgi:2'-hydroxyisoflavone reductase